jgi:predicted ATPase
MITSIKLSNFRAFQSTVEIQIRPITVLIGRNSAGKSSLIKFLLMLRQTLESQGDSFFVTNGAHVQLGTWKDLRNSRTREQRFRDDFCRFRITVATGDLPSPDIQALWQAASRTRVVSSEGAKTRVHLEFAPQALTKELQTTNFSIEGRIHYGRRFKYGSHEVSGILPNGALFRKRGENLERVGFLRFGQRTDSLEELIKGIAADRFLDALRYEFLSQRHLSPIREESQQAVQTGSPPPDDVGHRGEFAMPHLVDFFTNPEMAEEAKFITDFASSVARIDKLSFKSKLANMLTQVKGRNLDTQAINSLADFGFGVSQCLPIFVQGVMHHPGQLLLVEQPEAQLHPTAQLELGSFFAELWSKRSVPTIIETHSANVLLRLRRLVKDGRLKPADVSVAFFTVEKVHEPGRGTFPAVVVRNLEIDQEGKLSKGLPMEFFGADVLEAMEMATSPRKK